MSHRCSDVASSHSFSLCIPYHYHNMLRHLLLAISVLLSGLLYMQCVNEDIYLRSLHPDNRNSSMVLRNPGDYGLSPSMMVYNIHTNKPHRGGVSASTLMASSPSALRLCDEFAYNIHDLVHDFIRHSVCSDTLSKPSIHIKTNFTSSTTQHIMYLVWSGPILARTIDEEEFIIILCKSIATLCIAQLCVIVSHLY